MHIKNSTRSISILSSFLLTIFFFSCDNSSSPKQDSIEDQLIGCWEVQSTLYNGVPDNSDVGEIYQFKPESRSGNMTYSWEIDKKGNLFVDYDSTKILLLTDTDLQLKIFYEPYGSEGGITDTVINTYTRVDCPLESYITAEFEGLPFKDMRSDFAFNAGNYSGNFERDDLRGRYQHNNTEYRLEVMEIRNTLSDGTISRSSNINFSEINLSFYEEIEYTIVEYKVEIIDEDHGDYIAKAKFEFEALNPKTGKTITCKNGIYYGVKFVP